MSPIQQMLLGVGVVAEKTYIDDLVSIVPYRFIQEGTSRILRNVKTGLNFSRAGQRKFRIATHGTKFQVPSDWNNSNNSIECFGAGGTAGYHPNGSGGGGGGGYSRKNNVTLTPGSIVDMSIGQPTGPQGSYNGGSGGDTWFGHSSYASAICAAKGGGGGQSGGTAGAGGAAADGIGDVKYSGGSGASGSDGGSGGGCAGPNGNGGDGTSSGGGAGDNGQGGAGGTSSNGILGQAGTNITLLFGTIGSGGGGFGRQNGNGGDGGTVGGGGGATNGNIYNVGRGIQGEIFITYTPTTAGTGVDGMSWYKRRDGSGPHQVYDTVRGLGKYININSNADGGSNDNITSWTDTGMIVQQDSASDGQNHVFWNFKLNEKFFDIQTWTGNGTAGRQISHNLNSTPGCIMVKCTSHSSTEWIIYHRQMPQNNTTTNISNPQNSYITFDGYDFCADDAGKFNDTAPTTTNFTLGSDNDVNGSSREYVAYLWAHNDSDTTGEEGIFGASGDQEAIHCGSFVGNGSSQSIDLGWEPQWILIKSATNVGGANESEWFLFDGKRGLFTKADDPVYDARISPSQSSAEYFGDNYIEFKGNGFKVLSDARVNGNGNRLIYIAIRRPDGYVGKPPSLGTDVFTIDTGNGNSSTPNFDSNFPVDFQYHKNPTSTDNTLITARLTGRAYVRTDTNDQESSWGNFVFDSNAGWAQGGYSSTTQSWMWKRHSGLDVVCYEGNGTAGLTVKHSMNAVPEMMWVKNREKAADWTVYHKDLTNIGYYLKLNATNAQGYAAEAVWNNTAPTSTQFTLGTSTDLNESGSGHIAILFSSVSKISKVGSYTGSDSDQTITLGFQPRFLIVKAYNQAYSWLQVDTTRGWATSSGNNSKYLFLDLNWAQNDIDIGYLTSTGFVAKGGSGNINESGASYIYYAHA